MYFKTIVAVACLCLTSSCGWLQDTALRVWPWDTDTQAEINFTPQLKLKKVWGQSVRIDARNDTKFIPLQQGNAVFVADENATVSAFLAASGKRIWKQSFNETVSFAIGGSNTMMLGTETGKIIAFSPAHGRMRWKKRIANAAITAISDNHRGIILVRSADGGITAISATGKQHWKITHPLPALSLQGMSVPLMFQGYGLIGLDDGKLLVVDIETGQTVREIRIGLLLRGNDLERIVDIDGQMKIYDSVLYAASYKNRAIAFDLENNQIQWNIDIGSYAGLDADEEQVYLAETDGGVVAVNRHTGSIVWRNTQFLLYQLTAPLALGEFVVVGDEEGFLYWLSAADGSILARYDTGGKIDSLTLKQRKHVLVLNRDGDLLAIKAAARTTAPVSN